MRYGKLENGKLVYAPKVLKISETKEVINGNKELYENVGYKEIVSTPYPQVEEDKNITYICKWEETADKIIQVWEEHILEEPVSDKS